MISSGADRRQASAANEATTSVSPFNKVAAVLMKGMTTQAPYSSPTSGLRSGSPAQIQRSLFVDVKGPFQGLRVGLFTIANHSDWS